MENQERDYVVTACSREDLDGLYDDLETPGGTDHVPHRCVECVNRRPISRNTVYRLTDAEAEKLSADSRVLAVEPDNSDIVKVRPHWSRTGNFSKSGAQNSSHLNWGLIRNLDQFTVPGWGSDNIPDFTTTASTIYDGTGVDIVIVDGFILPNHPEFAVNANGSGGSRFNAFNWFSLNPIVNGSPAGTYVYAPSGYGGDDNSHGSHVAGIAAGNRQGWASGAEIFNLYIYGGSPGQGITGSNYIDYIRAWNSTKGNSNPTIVNNSWGSYYAFYWNQITSVTWRGNLYTPAGANWTPAELDTYGLVDRDNALTILYVEYWSAAAIADVQDAINEGIIFVGAAGNYGMKIDVPGGADYNNTVNTPFFSPNSFYYHRGSVNVSASNVICVGTTDSTEQDQKKSWSACGPRVDVYAPGVDIQSVVNDSSAFGGIGVTDPRNASFYIGKISGTSMASPQVAGMLALVAQQRGSLNQAQAYEYLRIHGVSTLSDPAPNSYTNAQNLQGSYNNWSTMAEYSISASATPIAPGGSTTFSITTTNVPQGTSLSYSTSGTAVASDFNPASTVGSVTIDLFGMASVVKTAAAVIPTSKIFSLNFTRTSPLYIAGGEVANSSSVTITAGSPPPPPPIVMSQPINLVPGMQYAYTDQYVVVDPTAPNHIHLRGGGAIDNSSAELYLGGEDNHFMVYDPAGSVTISAQNYVNFKGAQPIWHGSSTLHPIVHFNFAADGIASAGTASISVANQTFFGTLKCIIHGYDTVTGDTAAFEYILSQDGAGNMGDLAYTGVDSGAGALLTAAASISGGNLKLDLTNVAVSGNDVNARVYAIALALA